MAQGPGGVAEREDLDGSFQPEETIRAALEKVLHSRTFQSAEGQKRFLRYAAERTLEGRSHEVKEYTIGVEVFGRGASFDPRLDNIVRAEARKLRMRLAKYYEAEGVRDPVRIEFPSRGYVPNFRTAELAQVAAEADAPARPPEAELAAATALATVTARSAEADPTPQAKPKLPRKALPMALIAAGAVLLFISVALWSGHRQSAEAASIAVLPFRNLGDSQGNSFSDGLTDELIDSFGRVEGLQVVARTSAFQFRNAQLDIRDIGRRLNVRSVLEGSVRLYKERLRITAELDDTSNGYRIWSNSYDRDLRDVLFVQRDISQAIVNTLSAGFAAGGIPSALRFSPGKAAPVNAEAYQDYLRGLFFWNKQGADALQTAMSFFQQVIARDPGYAPAYTGLARCWANMPAFTRTRVDEVVPRIRALAQKALTIDEGLAEAHVDLAYAANLNQDWAVAESEFQKGLNLSPGSAVAHRWYAVYLSSTGRLEDALRENRTAQRLDPVSPYVLDGTARTLYLMRRYDQAIDESKHTLALDSQYGFAHLRLGIGYLRKHMYPQAFTELAQARQEMPGNPSPAAALGYAYAVSGSPEEARKILNQFLEQSAQGAFPAQAIAEIYIGLGDKDRALDWLTKAVEGQELNLCLKSDPLYDSLRMDTRFSRILRKAKLVS